MKLQHLIWASQEASRCGNSSLWGIFSSEHWQELAVKSQPNFNNSLAIAFGVLKIGSGRKGPEIISNNGQSQTPCKQQVNMEAGWQGLYIIIYIYTHNYELCILKTDNYRSYYMQIYSYSHIVINLYIPMLDLMMIVWLSQDNPYCIHQLGAIL